MADRLLVLIEQLFQENSRQAEVIQQLRDEIAVLKGEKAKPKFKASGMEDGADQDSTSTPKDDDTPGGNIPNKRPGSAKRSKTKHLAIHEHIT